MRVMSALIFFLSPFPTHPRSRWSFPFPLPVPLGAAARRRTSASAARPASLSGTSRIVHSSEG
jgi:hypothetical protein